MKKFTFFLATFLFPFFSNSQNLECIDLHSGTFELDGGQYGVTIITRTENSQIERNALMNFESHYDVIWKSDCSYELKNRKVIKGDLAASGPNDTVTAEVLNISGSRFLLRLSSNFSDFVIECELVKIDGS